MLITERLDKIVKIVNEKDSVDIMYLCDVLSTSKATIRRDLSFLHNEKKIIKVRGGAKKIKTDLLTKDVEISSRKNEYISEKNKIAKYCASLIAKNDYVYIDSGSSTEILASFIEKCDISFVTNSVSIALILARKGIDVYIIGGKLKPSTESIIGAISILELNDFNFSKGFFGTNGITFDGLTTPDIEEAKIKKVAMERCKEKYVLADSSKFNKLSLVKFSNFNDCIIVTDNTFDEYQNSDNIINLQNI